MSLAALASAALAIDAFAQAVTHRRYGETAPEGLYDPETGLWVSNVPWNPDPVETSIQAAVFAIQPHQVRDLPEGIQVVAQWTIWTRTALRADDDSAGIRADEILWQGEWHRVLLIWPRREGGFTKAVIGVIRDRGRTAHDAG